MGYLLSCRYSCTSVKLLLEGKKAQWNIGKKTRTVSLHLKSTWVPPLLALIVNVCLSQFLMWLVEKRNRIVCDDAVLSISASLSHHVSLSSLPFLMGTCAMCTWKCNNLIYFVLSNLFLCIFLLLLRNMFKWNIAYQHMMWLWTPL